MNITENQNGDDVWIGQPMYPETILEKFGMNNAINLQMQAQS